MPPFPRPNVFLCLGKTYILAIHECFRFVFDVHPAIKERSRLLFIPMGMRIMLSLSDLPPIRV